MNNEYYYKVKNKSISLNPHKKVENVFKDSAQSPSKSKSFSGLSDSPPEGGFLFNYQRVQNENDDADGNGDGDGNERNEDHQNEFCNDMRQVNGFKQTVQNGEENLNEVKIIEEFCQEVNNANETHNENVNKLYVNLTPAKISLKLGPLKSENKCTPILKTDHEAGAWPLLKKPKPVVAFQKQTPPLEQQQKQAHLQYQQQPQQQYNFKQQHHPHQQQKQKEIDGNFVCSGKNENEKIKKRDSFLPKVFSIVPLDKINAQATATNSLAKTTAPAAETTTNENTIGKEQVSKKIDKNDENFKLPTIVLKSYESSNHLPKTCTVNPSNRRRSTSSILKTTITPPLGVSNSLPRSHTTSNPIINSASLTILPPPPEFARRDSNKHKARQTLAQIRQDTEESIANTDSQVGNSTSPESILDQILSAASSLSIRSSSLSSGQAEVTNFASDLNTTANKYTKAQLNFNAIEPFPSPTQEIQKTSTLSTMSSTTSTSTTTMNTTRMMENTKENTNINRLLTPKSPEIIISQPPLRQLTSPSLSYTTLKQTLQLPKVNTLDMFESSSNRSRSPSPSPSLSIRVLQDSGFFPDEFKCKICSEILNDPRTLYCLHSFCFQCLVDQNFKHDSSIPFWSQPGGEEVAQKLKSEASNKSSYSLRSSTAETSLQSDSETNSSPSKQRRSSFSLMRKKSFDKIILKGKSNGKSSRSSSSSRNNGTTEEKSRLILCKICNYPTELPIGGLRQLPQNFLLVRKIEELKSKVSDDVLTKVWCTLCMEETHATHHCVTCTLNMCTLCKESHERQRSTANHMIRNIMEIKRSRKSKQLATESKAKFVLKCGMHPAFEMKSFCLTCLQVACADCLVLLHKGHKHETISKAISYYSKFLKDTTDNTRPLCSYAEHSIERMNDIGNNINRKCDEVQKEVEKYMKQYFEALEVHRKTLLNQINRARESKMEMILEQQMDLEKRAKEALEAIRFSQELCENASDVEILCFLNILLKRFDYCQQFKTPNDPKISDSLHFLPKIRAPSTKFQNNIPLYGIITMQIVEPSLCALEWEGFSQLRLNKKVELTMVSYDGDNLPLCHGGLSVTGIIKYKEIPTKFLPVEISDNRDGTYTISFTPDAQGNILLTVTVNDKQIKGSPYTFLVRSVRPHTGIYHCCAFCSSKSNKLVTCCCEGRMPGFNGCGHGHAGHPGRRHWSCCGNILENSECSAANKLLNN